MYKEYKVKNGTGATTTAENEIFIGLTWKLLFSTGELTFGQGSLLGVNFSRLGDEQILAGGGSPPTPLVGKLPI